MNQRNPNSAFLAGVVLRVLCFVAMFQPIAFGQDLVIEKKPDGTQVQRKGTIIDWRSVSLKLDQAGRIREIDNDQIESIQTRWPPKYNQALTQIENGDLSAAAGGLIEAAEQERRPWARNVILAELVPLQQSLGQHTSAAESFFRMARNDPQSRFLHLAPLPWETGKLSGSVPSQSQAQKWLNSAVGSGTDSAAVSLVAASWLMPFRQREARVVLEELAMDLDPTISALAVGQLWRQQKSAINAKLLIVWRRRLKLMPQPASAGPLYTLAQAELASSMTAEALRDFMRIVILHPDQKNIAAPALYRAATLLHNEDRAPLAAALSEELKSKYPQSPWAKEASFDRE